jgi:hypothetical protein
MILSNNLFFFPSTLLVLNLTFSWNLPSFIIKLELDYIIKIEIGKLCMVFGDIGAEKAMLQRSMLN